MFIQNSNGNLKIKIDTSESNEERVLDLSLIHIQMCIRDSDLPARWGSHIHMLADIAFHIRELGQSAFADQLVIFSWTRWKMFCESKDERTLFELYRLMLANVVDFSNLAIAEIADRYFLLFERCSSCLLYTSNSKGVLIHSLVCGSVSLCCPHIVSMRRNSNSCFNQ